MDIVITYVDGRDPAWQQDYERTMNVPVMAKRYRDWDTLRFLFRGIERHMPFIRNVWLVVSRDSQVPAWIDRSQVHVVLHEEIIPAEYLPTFNSTTIEMFLHRIPGLSEQFLYFNDDMYPVMDMTPEDFYPGGKAAMGFARCLFARGMYKRQTRNSDWLAREALGLKPGLFFRRPQHTCSPMLRSFSEEAFGRVAPQILSRLSRARTMENFNQYFFLDYLLYSGRAVSRRLSNKHFSLAAASIGRICAFLEQPNRKLVCINDVHMKESVFQQARERLLAAFSHHFPEPSRFER